MLAVTLKAHTHTSPPPPLGAKPSSSPASGPGRTPARQPVPPPPPAAGRDGRFCRRQPARPAHNDGPAAGQAAKALVIFLFPPGNWKQRHDTSVRSARYLSGQASRSLTCRVSRFLLFFYSPTLSPFPLPFFRLYKLSHLSCCQPARLHCSLPLVLRFLCSCLARKGAPFHLPTSVPL